MTTHPDPKNQLPSPDGPCITVAQLTGTEADWGSGQPDYFAPNFGATWNGSPKEAAQARRIAAYAEAQRRRTWGE